MFVWFEVEEGEGSEERCHVSRALQEFAGGVPDVLGEVEDKGRLRKARPALEEYKEYESRRFDHDGKAIEVRRVRDCCNIGQ